MELFTILIFEMYLYMQAEFLLWISLIKKKNKIKSIFLLFFSLSIFSYFFLSQVFFSYPKWEWKMKRSSPFICQVISNLPYE